jgi:hypothetical protein
VTAVHFVSQGIMRRTITLLLVWTFLFSASVGADGRFLLCRPAQGPAHVDGPLRRCPLHALAPGGSVVGLGCTDSALTDGAGDAISVPPERLHATALFPVSGMLAVGGADPHSHRPPLQAPVGVGPCRNEPLSQRRTVVLVI